MILVCGKPLVNSGPALLVFYFFFFFYQGKGSYFYQWLHRELSIRVLKMPNVGKEGSLGRFTGQVGIWSQTGSFTLLGREKKKERKITSEFYYTLKENKISQV